MRRLTSAGRAALAAVIILAVAGAARGPLPTNLGPPTRSDEGADEAETAAAFSGRWVLVADRSTPVDPWRDLDLELSVDGSEVDIRRIWSAGARNRHVDSLRVAVDGEPVQDRIHHWADSRHLGVYVGPDSTRSAVAQSLDGGRTLQVTTVQTLHTSQGSARVRVYSEYRISDEGDELALLELRSSRNLPLHYLFRRVENTEQ